jgi:SAM-dependent methyltransferase
VDSLYSHPELYSQLHDSRTHDLPHYQALARAALGDILEIGAGTGRVTMTLARAGHRVVAVERDRAMLSSLEARLLGEPEGVQARVTLVAGDATQLDLRRRFPLVICTFNAIAHQHSFDALRRLLEGVRRHLEPRGVFAFDSSIPNRRSLDGASGYVPWFRHPRNGQPCRAVESTRYDPCSEVLEIAMTITPLSNDQPSETTRLYLKQRYPERLRAELIELGWTVIDCNTIGEDVFWTCR